MKKVILGLLIASAAFSASAQEFIEGEVNHIPTSQFQVCTIPLPITPSTAVNRMMLNTKHIYLKINGQTYGTPHTAKFTYVGGDAYLYKDDLFYRETKGEGEECFDVKYKESEDEDSFIKRASCIAEKLSVRFRFEAQGKEWYPIFDYNFMTNNCGSMAKFVVQCVDGVTDETFNYSVGDEVPASKPAKIINLLNGEKETISSTYGEICKRAQDECGEDAGLIAEHLGL